MKLRASVWILAWVGCGAQGASSTHDSAIVAGDPDAGSAVGVLDTAPDLVTVSAPDQAAPNLVSTARLNIDDKAWNLEGSGLCASHRFRVSNAGGSPTGPIATRLEGAFAFGLDGCRGMVLEAGGDCQVEVQLPFMAPVGSSGPGTLTVNADPGGEVQAKLQGAVLPWDTLTVSPNVVAFATTTIGKTSAATTFTVNNLGGQDLQLATATVSTADFAISGDQCSGRTLLANDSCELGATFVPASRGAKSAILSLAASGCGGLTEVTATLAATALATDAGLVADPAAKDFGGVNIPCSSDGAMIRIRNLAPAARGPLAVTVSTPFQAPGNCQNRTLAPGEECDVQVTFVPSSEGTQVGTLRVAADDDQVEVSLLGEGVHQPDPAFSPTTQDFGALSVGQKGKPVEVTLYLPASAFPVSFAFQVTGVAAADYDIVAQTCTTAPDGAVFCRVFVSFTPSAAGVRPAALVAGGNQSCSGAATLPLAGTGL